MRKLSLLIGILAFLAGLLPAQRLHAQGATPPPLQFAQVPCAHGAYIAGSACINGQVLDAEGRRLAGRDVRLTWTDPSGRPRSLRSRTAQRPIDPVGEAGFSFIIPSDQWSPGAPWTIITLRATIGGQPVERRLLLRPDPLTLSLRADLRPDMGRRPDRPPVEGRVFVPGSPVLTDTVTVRLSYSGDGQTQVLTESTRLDPPSGEQRYSFPRRPGLPALQAGAPVTLVATSLISPELRQTVLLSWPGQPVEVDLYLGWGCDYVIPKSGGKSLPDRFCVSGRVLVAGRPLQPGQTATVLVRAGDRSATARTGDLDPQLELDYALDIGELIRDLPAATTVEFAASLDSGQASDLLTTTVGDLRSAGLAFRVDLDLLPEWSVAADLPIGGRVLATASASGFEARLIEGSGLWLQRAGGGWQYPGPLQPCREGTALAFEALPGAPLPAIDCRDHAGVTHRSLDGGQTWGGAPRELPPSASPALGTAAGAVPALLPTEDAFIAGTSGGVFSVRQGEVTTLGAPLSGDVRQAITCADGAGAEYLVVLAAQGLYRRLIAAPPTEPWEQVAAGLAEPLNGQALARVGARLIVGRSASRSQILVGDACGGPLRSASFDSRSPITALTAAGGRVFAATRDAGVWVSDDGEQWRSSSVGLPTAPATALATLEDGGACTVYAVAGAGAPGLFERSCGDDGGPWQSTAADPQARIPAGLVTRLAVTRLPGSGPAEGRTVYYAASDAGLLKRTGRGAWVVRGADAGPLRLLDVTIPASYPAERRLLVAGMGGQVLSYGDIAPDLNLSLELAPLHRRPGEPITATVTLQNLGGQTARSVRLAIDPGPYLQGEEALQIALPDILPGEPVSRSLRLVIPAQTPLRAGQTATLTATVTSDGDGYLDNDLQTAEVQALPPRGPDLSMYLTTGDALKPGAGQMVDLALVYASVGEERATGARLRLDPIPEQPRAEVRWQNRWQQLPLEIPLGSLEGTEAAGGPGCKLPCRRHVRLRFPDPLTEGQQLTVAGRISAERDRAPENNADTLSLTVGVPPVETVFLVNYQRPSVGWESVRQELDSLAPRIGAVELRLDLVAADDWARIDAALSRGDTAAAARHTMDLVAEARQEIERVHRHYLNLKYVVIVGGDSSIPYGVALSRVRSQGDNLPESAILERPSREADIPRSTPLYATLAQNYYPSDDAYVVDPLGDQLPSLIVARLVETPGDIAHTLRSYGAQLDGRPGLDLSHPGVIGFAPQLTEDHWGQACAEIGGGPCYRTLADLKQRTEHAYLQVGGHGNPWTVGDIGASRLMADVVRSSRPLVVTVSCHTGLSIPQQRSLPPAIIAPWAESSGGAYIASLGYAYGSMGAVDYNEELALLFHTIVLHGAPGREMTVGEALREARERYRASRGAMSALDWKVLRGIALYGLPMQRLGDPPLPPQMAARQSAASGADTAGPDLLMLPPQMAAQQPAAPAELTMTGSGLVIQRRRLALSYRLVAGEPDTSGRADYGPATAQGAQGEYGTRQPYFQDILEPIVDPETGRRLVPTAALLSESAYDALAGFDPLVNQVIALGSEPRLHEPADRTAGVEQTRLVTTGALPGGRLLVRLWLGQYRAGAAGPLQHFLRDPQLTVVYAPEAPAGPARTPGVKICRAPAGGIAVSVPAKGLALAYATFTSGDGRWRSAPMDAAGGARTAWLPAPPGLELFVQTVDTAGRSSTLVRGDHAYFTAGDAACTSTAGPGPLARYTFDEGEGTVIHDVSGVGEPLDLEARDRDAIRWLDGALAVEGQTIIASATAAAKITEAVRQSHELTIEWWGRPANAAQDGPARIVTLSATPYTRNVTLAQGRWDDQPSSVYDGRIRTTATGPNGMPSITTPEGSLTTELTHVVLTRDADGTTRIFVNGVEAARGRARGDLSGWDATFHLALANELTLDRPWLGEYHEVAIYDRALSPEEVRGHSRRGPD